MTRLLVFVMTTVALTGWTGCGYTLRGNTRPFFERNQIRTLYVAPVKNNSYKAGVEITVYNALRKRLAQGNYVRLVDASQLADAEIVASVLEASYAPLAITRADQISPIGTGPDNVQIASSYNVVLKLKFELKGREKMLWGDELSRSKTFQAATYMGALGSTSALINEGEFEKTLSDLSASLVTDAEESINTLF